MVLVMIPGLGFLYSGLARRKSALTMLWITMASFSVITFQWYFWGYSLAFSAQGTSGFIGDLKHFGLTNTLGAPSPGSPLIPELLYSFYQVPGAFHFATLQYMLILPYSCNSAPPQPPLHLVPSLSEVVCSPSSFSFSVGPRLSTVQLLVGLGISTAGVSNMASRITPAAGPSK